MSHSIGVEKHSTKILDWQIDFKILSPQLELDFYSKKIQIANNPFNLKILNGLIISTDYMSRSF